MAATATDILLDSRRRAYLAALGIPQYHPRRQLAGALPSSLLADQLPVAARTVGLEQVSSLLVPEHSRDSAAEHQASVHAALAQLQVAAAPSTAQAADAQTAADSSPAAVLPPVIEVAATVPDQAQEKGDLQAEMSAFAFAFVPVNEQIAVINELPPAGATALSTASRQLLAGILRALMQPCEERHLSSLNFVWPLPDMPLAERGEGPARELLKGFLAQRFRIRPVRYLLVLAERSAPYLLPADFKLQQGSLFRHPDFDVDMLVTRSLGAMEAVPGLKREVWSALQPLLAALKASARQDS